MLNVSINQNRFFNQTLALKQSISFLIIIYQSVNQLINQTNKVAKKYAVSQWHKGKVTGYSFRTDTYRYTVWIDKKKITITAAIR